ncbi:MAG: TauD/TfdA family dioxygenase [Pseudomonadota bacterium]
MRWRLRWTNPANGLPALYIASHAFAIDGMPQSEAQSLLASLIDEATKPAFTHLHRWRAGDVVMWGQPRDDASRPSLAGRSAAPHGPHHDLGDRTPTVSSRLRAAA